MNTPIVPKRILVPVDLSTRSEAGVAYAAMLAACTGAELVVMANINLPEQDALEQFMAGEQISLDEAAVAAINRIISAQAPEATTSSVIRFHDFPGDGILDAAASENVDMIVITSHGRSGMTRWMLGSVAEKVARGAQVPVVIVPARASS